MKAYHGQSPQGKKEEQRVALPAQVQVTLDEVLGAAKEGLLAFSVAVGLQVMQQLLAEEVTASVGPRGKHDPMRQASRHGTEDGQVVLGGRKVAIKRPRARTTNGEEVRLETYAAFQDENLLPALALERMIHGLSTRRYEHGLEPVGTDLPAKGTGKSTVSRRFIQATQRALTELLARPLDEQRYLVLLIDGIEFAEHMVVVALGITADGQKQILGLREGATENATVCRALLADLVERGLQTDAGILAVIDGAKALKAAVTEVFGDKAVIQRCQAHKKRNVVEHLPEKERVWVGRKLDQAWQESDHSRALIAMKRLAHSLEDKYPGAAASLREGLEETLTLLRLGVPERLRRTLRTTNPIESAFDKVRMASRNVKRWQNGQQVLRWAAAGLFEAEKGFRRLQGYRELPVLADALRHQALPDSPTKVQTA